MPTPFRQHTEVLSKSPAADHGLVGRSPASAEEDGLLFGDFLLAIQEKVTRPPQEVETLLILMNASLLPANHIKKSTLRTLGAIGLR